jgi:hypothetical protein
LLHGWPQLSREISPGWPFIGIQSENDGKMASDLCLLFTF